MFLGMDWVAFLFCDRTSHLLVGDINDDIVIVIDATILQVTSNLLIESQLLHLSVGPVEAIPRHTVV